MNVKAQIKIMHIYNQAAEETAIASSSTHFYLSI